MSKIYSYLVKLPLKTVKEKTTIAGYQEDHNATSECSFQCSYIVVIMLSSWNRLFIFTGIFIGIGIIGSSLVLINTVSYPLSTQNITLPLMSNISLKNIFHRSQRQIMMIKFKIFRASSVESKEIITIIIVIDKYRY